MYRKTNVQARIPCPLWFSINLRKKIWFFMKVNLLALLLITLGMQLLLASPGKGQTLAAEMITLECNKASLKAVFAKIEKQSDFRFAYKREQVEKYRSVTVQRETRTLEETLNLVLQNTNLAYKVINKHIILLEKESEQHKELEPDTDAGILSPDGVIQGKVTNVKGDVISGATVTLEKTNKIVAANDRGEFHLANIKPGNYILKVTAVGYIDHNESIRVGDGTLNISVTLTETSSQLSEVVVTAFGIQRQAKSLTYATQKIDGEKLNEVRDGNIANTLNGKVAGLVINQGAQGPGSASRIILRGNKSIGGDNGALIVLDGVIINNSTGGENGAWTGADGISSINADDVESINVLKGSSASALYGTQGANGVIIITTKKGKAGKVAVDVNSGANYETPLLYPEVQNEYSQGNGGIFGATAGSSWGEKINGQQVTDWTGKQDNLTAQPDNIKDYFKKSLSTNNSVGISAGSEKIQTYFSYANNYYEGLVPQNRLNRHTVNLRLGTQLSKRFSTDTKITYVHQDIFDKPAVNSAASAAMNIYKIPRTVRLEDVRNYETIDNLGIATPNYWFSSSSFGNPYWTVYNTHRNDFRDRITGLVSAKYAITDWLDIQARYSMDLINDKVNSVFNNNTVNFGRNGGSFSYSLSQVRSSNFDVIISGRNNITPDLKVNYNVGGVVLDNHAEAQSTSVEGLIVPNRFNLAFAKTQVSNNSFAHIQRQAIFGGVQLSFKDYLFADITARQEYFSTLPPPYYSFYPSFGLGLILSDMVRLPAFVSYAKVRAGYAKTGGGGPGFLTKQTFSLLPGGFGGFISRDPTSPFPELKPELTTGKEIGTEWRFFGERLAIDTLYQSNTINQLIQTPTPAATGFSTQYINVGDIQNSGVEIVLSGTPVRQPNGLTWDMNINFAKNKNKVSSLIESVKQVFLGNDIVDFMVPEVKEGGSYGDVYAYGWRKNDNGEFMVDENGRPLRTEELTKIGNYNPDYTIGWSNSFSWKNFTASFLIDGRFGGVMTSASDAVMAADGTPDYTTAVRDAGSWLLPAVREDGSKNAVPINSETFWTTVSGGRLAWGEEFTYDATNVRLRELSIGYRFNRLPVSFIKSAKVSLVARNVFFFYRGYSTMDLPGVPKRRANFDSEVNLFNGNFQGLEYGTLPPTRSIGVNLKLSL
jgi:TonB-linked SusC/RagA family outer membrane protein